MKLTRSELAGLIVAVQRLHVACQDWRPCPPLVQSGTVYGGGADSDEVAYAAVDALNGSRCPVTGRLKPTPETVLQRPVRVFEVPPTAEEVAEFERELAATLAAAGVQTVEVEYLTPEEWRARGGPDQD